MALKTCVQIGLRLQLFRCCGLSLCACRLVAALRVGADLCAALCSKVAGARRVNLRDRILLVQIV